MLPAYLLPALYHQEGMIPRPKLIYTADRRDKVSFYDTVFCPLGTGGMSRFGESDPSLIVWQTVNRSPEDLGRAPLEKGRWERVAQIVFHGMELRTYAWGGVLNKIPLLLERLLQAYVGYLLVTAYHPGHNYHQSLPDLQLLL